MKRYIYLFFFISQTLISQDILPLRDRAHIIDAIQKDRIQNLLPKLMQEQNLDLWVLITREYNEDPVVKTLLPPTWLNARRRTILVFSKTKNGVDAVAISRYNFGNNIRSIWNKEKQPDQWLALSEYIQSQKPQQIGINVSEYYGIADGLVKTDYEGMMKALPKAYQNKVVSAEKLAVRWIETRTSVEMILFSQLVEITHNIISKAFSAKVITPGATTTEDVVWWLREKVLEMGLDTWFHPTVDVQRSGKSDLYAFDGKSKYDVINPGDLLHCDFGISYLTLNTDCQELAYVLKPGEIRAPSYLEEALSKGNAVQDHLTKNYKKGKTGNAILKQAISDSKAEGLRPQIYTHPLGFFGHSAGTTIGMWDSQEGVPGTGDHPMHEGTVYAIELNTKVFIPEWEKDIRVMLEEAGYFGHEGFRYVNGRQKKLLLVGGKENHLE
ncbi:MAG: M24 family metallopeptidase [Flavobacteriales bacterium]|jgi:Xaa-Pro aminopeptidase|tara:strand:+ start:4788 stop:6107 length:1320 start_codon:yes stop_codon:yes gene_type:complete